MGTEGIPPSPFPPLPPGIPIRGPMGAGDARPQTNRSGDAQGVPIPEPITEGTPWEMPNQSPIRAGSTHPRTNRSGDAQEMPINGPIRVGMPERAPAHRPMRVGNAHPCTNQAGDAQGTPTHHWISMGDSLGNPSHPAANQQPELLPTGQSAPGTPGLIQSVLRSPGAFPLASQSA